MTLIAQSEELLPTRQAAPARWRGYGRYLLGKVLGSLGSLVFMLVVSFFLFRVLPGDPARTLGRGRFTTPEQLEEFRHAYGLDKSVWEQFVIYAKGIVTGDLGISLSQRKPVTVLISDSVWPTLLLVGTATILSVLIGVWAGIRGGWNRGGGFDQTSTATSLTMYSMPEWWLGLLLIMAFAVGVGPFPGVFPTGGLHSSGMTPGTPSYWVDTAWHLVLPVTTLTLAYLADYLLIMRSSILGELSEDYLVTARAKGLRDIQVRNRHAVRNALLPTTTVIALNIGFIVSGAITVETVFSIPGLGLLATEALAYPDFPVLQGTFLVATTAVIVANLAANLLYGALDPRVRT